MPRTLTDMLVEAVALRLNMHDSGDNVYITLQQIDIIATSQPLCFMRITFHSITEWHPRMSETVYT